MIQIEKEKFIKDEKNEIVAKSLPNMKNEKIIEKETLEECNINT